MAVVSISGADFEFSYEAVTGTSQVTSGTVTQTPTIVRTKTLDEVAFNQTDLVSAVSITFLYDDNTGLYDALATAAAAGTASGTVTITGKTGVWTGEMWVDSLETSFEAAGVSTCTVSLTGQLAFS